MRRARCIHTRPQCHPYLYPPAPDWRHQRSYPSRHRPHRRLRPDSRWYRHRNMCRYTQVNPPGVLARGVDIAPSFSACTFVDVCAGDAISPYPALQAHSYAPSVLVQVAFASQETVSAHSSISAQLPSLPPTPHYMHIRSCRQCPCKPHLITWGSSAAHSSMFVHVVPSPE